MPIDGNIPAADWILLNTPQYTGTHFVRLLLELHPNVSFWKCDGMMVNGEILRVWYARHKKGHISFDRLVELANKCIPTTVDWTRRQLDHLGIPLPDKTVSRMLVQIHLTHHQFWYPQPKMVVSIRDPLLSVITTMRRGAPRAGDAIVAAYKFLGALDRECCFWFCTDLWADQREKALDLFDYLGLEPTEGIRDFVAAWPAIRSTMEGDYEREENDCSEDPALLEARRLAVDKERVHPIVEPWAEKLRSGGIQALMEDLGYRNLVWFEQKARQISKTSERKAQRMSKTSVSFYHGLGDSANFARMIPLYTRRGHEIAVECLPTNEILFRAAGATIVQKADHVHPWRHSPAEVHAGHGWDWKGSKLAWNICRPPLPIIGKRGELWQEYCKSEVRTASHVPQADADFIRKWLEPLPRPVVVFHARSDAAQPKSLPDELANQFRTTFLDECGGSLVLLDRAYSTSCNPSDRVRHAMTMPGGCTTERLLALLDQADLMVGPDSGPLHACALTDTPSVGIWMPDHHPVRYALPRHNQLNVVLTKYTQQWNRYRRIPWNIVEQPGKQYSGSVLFRLCNRMFTPRYFPASEPAFDVQMQHWIWDWCRAREASFDLLFRETSKRFDAPTIIETGTIRSEEGWSGAGFFTYLAGAYLHRAGGQLFSVELNKQNANFAREWCGVFGNAVKIRHRDSVTFLRRFDLPIDVLYLDSLDTYKPGHAEHALAEIQAAMPHLHDKSLVIFDDTPCDGGVFTGKGAQAVPWLLKRGWDLLYSRWQAILSQTECVSQRLDRVVPVLR